MLPPRQLYYCLSLWAILCAPVALQADDREALDRKVQPVIDEIDKLCRENTVYMIGPEKGKRLAELVRKNKSKLVVECGTAIGYSGLWIARELKAAGQGKLITIEIDAEDIGNSWTSNSAWRAKGHKQVDLVDGAMHVTRHPEADHGVAIFHKVAFQDRAVEIKFKLGPGDAMRVSLDGKPVGEFQSEGIAHPTKRMITLAVNKSAWVDDVKVWKRK